MANRSDLAFFAALVRAGSLSAAARDLDVTPSAVSKWLAQLEARIGVRLVARTTRHLSLTQEGEIYLSEGRRILADMDDLERAISSSKAAPMGLLKVQATPGFGRKFIAPAIAAFATLHPRLDIELTLTDRSPRLEEDAVDVAVRFGPPADGRIMARRLAPHRRRVFAAPRYLESRPAPTVPSELAQHNCLIVRQGDLAYGQWHFSRGRKSETVKVRGTLSSNEGAAVLTWALQGHGVILRSEWDAAPFVRSGELVVLLEDYALPPADLYAVYPQKQNLPAKTRAFVEHLAHAMAGHAEAGDTRW